MCKFCHGPGKTEDKNGSNGMKESRSNGKNDVHYEPAQPIYDLWAGEGQIIRNQ